MSDDESKWMWDKVSLQFYPVEINSIFFLFAKQIVSFLYLKWILKCNEHLGWLCFKLWPTNTHHWENSCNSIRTLESQALCNLLSQYFRYSKYVLVHQVSSVEVSITVLLQAPGSLAVIFNSVHALSCKNFCEQLWVMGTYMCSYGYRVKYQKIFTYQMHGTSMISSACIAAIKWLQ